MSESTFFVSSASVRNLKRAADHSIDGVGSSHLSEGVAAALGFRTHAALKAALKNQPTVEASKPNNAVLVQRLRDFGYPIAAGSEILPEFDQSYTPFKRFPLRKHRTLRWLAWRNLIVAAVNAGIEQRLFGLSPEDNWWPGSDGDSQQCQRAAYPFVFDGNLPAVASVDAISGDELSISVVINPRRPNDIPQWYWGLSDGDAVAHGWVERRLGAWIQDGGEAFHSKRVMQPRLSAANNKPLGYADQGSFFL